MTVSGTNFGKAAEDYGTFRAGFPESIFDRLAEFNVGLPDHTVIDLGTGTGTLARKFDADLKELLSARFPSSVLAVPHRVFAIVAVTHLNKGT